GGTSSNYTQGGVSTNNPTTATGLLSSTGSLASSVLGFFGINNGGTTSTSNPQNGGTTATAATAAAAAPAAAGTIAGIATKTWLIIGVVAIAAFFLLRKK